MLSEDVQQLPIQFQMECLLIYLELYDKKPIKAAIEANAELQPSAVVDHFIEREWLYTSENMTNSDKLIQTTSQRRFHGFFARFLIKNRQIERLREYLNGFRKRLQEVPFVALQDAVFELIIQGEYVNKVSSPEYQQLYQMLLLVMMSAQTGMYLFDLRNFSPHERLIIKERVNKLNIAPFGLLIRKQHCQGKRKKIVGERQQNEDDKNHD